MTTFPLQQKTEYPHATLLKTTKDTPKDGAVTIYQLELHNRLGGPTIPVVDVDPGKGGRKTAPGHVQIDADLASHSQTRQQAPARLHHRLCQLRGHIPCVDRN